MTQKYLHLKNRKILKISGLNCVVFLNNILTSEISVLGPLEIIPSALLSPQGRVLFDLLVSKNFRHKCNEVSILIEYDKLCEDEFIKRLNMYNLRNEVNIEKTKLDVFVTINNETTNNYLVDKRFAKLGYNIKRIYEENHEITLDNQNTKNFINWYDLIRFKLCIAEGPNEIEANSTLPLEVNLDLLGGISFEKGCFIGQEVNARIKYKGLVKRKYVPIYFKNKDFNYIEIDENINKKIFLKGIEIGEIIALSYNQKNDTWYGIAKIKLSQLYLFEQNNELEGDFLGSKIKISFPEYMLPLPKKF